MYIETNEINKPKIVRFLKIKFLIYLFIYLFIRRENKDEMEQMLKVWQDNSMCERYVFYIRCE